MAVAAKLFAPDEELLQIWANFTEKSDEKCFTKFVKVSTSYPVSFLKNNPFGEKSRLIEIISTRPKNLNLDSFAHESQFSFYVRTIKISKAV